MKYIIFFFFIISISHSQAQVTVSKETKDQNRVLKKQQEKTKAAEERLKESKKKQEEEIRKLNTYISNLKKQIKKSIKTKEKLNQENPITGKELAKLHKEINNLENNVSNDENSSIEINMVEYYEKLYKIIKINDINIDIKKVETDLKEFNKKIISNKNNIVAITKNIDAISKEIKEKNQKYKNLKRLGTAKPCNSKKRMEKYQCYKQNMKVAHENLFGYWKSKYDKQKKLKDDTDKIAKLDQEKLNEKCSENTDTNIVLKDFQETFCNNGILLKRYQGKKGQNKLKKNLNYWKFLAKSRLKKAKNKFNKELEAYDANAKWFTLQFLKELINEEDPVLRTCIEGAYVKEGEDGTCFYSHRDVVNCFSLPNVTEKDLRVTLEEIDENRKLNTYFFYNIGDNESTYSSNSDLYFCNSLSVRNGQDNGKRQIKDSKQPTKEKTNGGSNGTDASKEQ